jgi:KH domain
LAWCTGAEVNFSGNCFEINGNDNAIRILIDLLLKGEFDFYSQYPYRIRIRCEMANELQEFVAGKKSGKVNKITKTTNCNITFESYTEYNFLIDIMAPQLEEIYDGYKQLLEEFPAELYWFVPEEYHKRIIGVQGKTIQRIMKHYSVYVKFFNALEFAASGGDSKTEDNVLARTPAKNQHALDECKKAVLEMVFQNVCAFSIILTFRTRTISQRQSRSPRPTIRFSRSSVRRNFKILAKTRALQSDFPSTTRPSKQLQSLLLPLGSRTSRRICSILFR